jgi:hypothetical protein
MSLLQRTSQQSWGRLLAIGAGLGLLVSLAFLLGAWAVGR